MRGWLPFALLLVGCGPAERPRALGAGSGVFTAPAAPTASSSLAPTAGLRVQLTRVSSLTSLPRTGTPARSLAATSDSDWLEFAEHGVNIFARGVDDGTGDIYLPLFEPTTWGLPVDDVHGTLVLQLVDASGEPISGAWADALPCGTGPYYDDGDAVVDHGSTGNRGTIVILDATPGAGASLNVHVGADVFVAQLPVVGGKVTWAQSRPR